MRAVVRVALVATCAVAMVRAEDALEDPMAEELRRLATTNTPTLDPTHAPSVTIVPTTTPAPSESPSPVPTMKPTEFDAYGFAKIGSAQMAMIQAIVAAVCLVREPLRRA